MLARFVVAFSLFAVLAPAGLAANLVKPQRHVPAQGAVNFPDDSISIITESLSATSGHDDDRIAELARAYAAAGLPRVLPVAGLGPIANAHDLLHMRGIDLAVIDSDIVAYARIDGAMPGVASHLQQVLKLGEKTVYIIAAKDVRSFADLARQKVLALGEDSVVLFLGPGADHGLVVAAQQRIQHGPTLLRTPRTNNYASFRQGFKNFAKSPAVQLCH